jgi:murein tripeptide amidase MpaA
MFPDSNRPVRINKPVVLVTCRVHPGEVSASHALTGMLDFLCLSEDPRAYLLRRLFVFMIIPMVNPDGVY